MVSAVFNHHPIRSVCSFGNNHTVTALLFGAIKSSIGGTQNIFYRATVLGEDGDSRRQSNSFMKLIVILPLQLFGLLPQMFSALLSHLHRGIRHNQRELLAAIAAGNILAADMTLQELAKFAQERIARGMTISVVEAFEVVNVDHDDAQWV